MALPPRDQRHQYLRFEGLGYTDVNIIDFEERLGKIYGREIHWVQVFDFGGLIDLMAKGLSGRMLMEHGDAQGQKAVLNLDTTGALQLQLRGVRRRMRISSARGFLGTSPYYTSIRDPMLRLYHKLIACNIVGRSQEPEKFVARLAEHFGLLIEERLQGLAVIVQDLLMIDMAKLVRLQICKELDDTWSWVALRPERQPDVAAARPARTMAQRLGRLEEDVYGLRGALGEQRERLGSDTLAIRIIRFRTRGSLDDLAGKKSTMLVKYLQSRILAH
ncbi:hypothetical protein Tco_0666711 [Tanacetum coccineum]